MDSFNQLLNKEDSNLDTSLIMYAEQLARKDVEINSLRSKRKELEGRVRQGLEFSCRGPLVKPVHRGPIAEDSLGRFP